MAVGDLECPGDILPTAMADVTDTMIPGVMAVMVVIMVDMAVPTGAVITTATGMDIMMEEDITIPLPMHMAKWIAAALTDIPGRPKAAPEVQAGRRFWTQKRQCQGQTPNQAQALHVPMFQLTMLLLKPHVQPPRQAEAILRLPEAMFQPPGPILRLPGPMFQPPGPIHRPPGPMFQAQGVIQVPNLMW